MVNTYEWWHFYCDSLKKYGMKYDYSKSKFVPKLENKVFSIEDNYINFIIENGSM